MQQALDVLKWIANVNAMDYEYQRKAREPIEALEQELAKPEKELPTLRQVVIESALKGYGKPEQEPTWATVKHYCDRIVELEVQLASLRKPWVGLTDKEMLEIWRQHGSYETLFKKVEIKLKDKNT